MPKKLRKLGDVLLDIEPLLLELSEEHGLQWGDVLSLVHVYLSTHFPGGREEYEDGTHPEFFYGSRE